MHDESEMTAALARHEYNPLLLKFKGGWDESIYLVQKTFFFASYHAPVLMSAVLPLQASCPMELSGYLVHVSNKREP